MSKVSFLSFCLTGWQDIAFLPPPSAKKGMARWLCTFTYCLNDATLDKQEHVSSSVYQEDIKKLCLRSCQHGILSPQLQGCCQFILFILVFLTSCSKCKGCLSVSSGHTKSMSLRLRLLALSNGIDSLVYVDVGCSILLNGKQRCSCIFIACVLNYSQGRALLTNC